MEDITKYYYLQRGNEIIEEKYVGKLFARGEGLPQDRSVPLNSQRESSKDMMFLVDGMMLEIMENTQMLELLR